MPPPNKGAPPPLPNAGGGDAGGAVAPCKWEMEVNVHSQERFWPKKDFDVQIGLLDAKGAMGAAAQSQTIKMLSKESPAALFKGQGKASYGVTATVAKIAGEEGWQLGTGKTSMAPLAGQHATAAMADGMRDAKKKHVDLFINHPLRMYLQLKVKDPEARELTFPDGFPVGVYHGDKRVANGKTDADGKVDFEVPRSVDWVTLKFGQSDAIISNGDGKTLKTELKTAKDRPALAKAEAKYFCPPAHWSLVEAEWKLSEMPKYIDGAEAYKDTEGKIYLFDAKATNWVRRIGEKAAPVELLLDPKWQYVRLEYFDRYFGHADHGHLRVNTPTVLLEAYHREAKSKTLEGAGHWTLLPTDVSNSVHCVPWIRQKDAKGAAKLQPDVKSLLQMEHPAGTYAVSKDKDTRVLEAVPDKDLRLPPGAERLKLYDMPASWQSANYYARYKDGGGKYPGKFFESWPDADIRKSQAQATPMIFSLDDIVFTDSAFKPVKLANTDRFAYFFHRFKPAYQMGKADVSEEGVYHPDTGAQEPYLSTVMAEGPDFNYVTDYPNWVRLASGLGSVWDIFEHRAMGDVKGARAAVRWFDTLSKGTAASDATLGWPGTINKPYFSIQPYYGQKQHDFTDAYDSTGAHVMRYGRFDMVLARCADRIGADELFMNLQLTRYIFSFLPTSAHAKNAAAQGTFKQNATTGIMGRWNGTDGVSPARAELVPQDGKANHKGEVIHFVQAVPTLKEAHINLRVSNMGGGRASMGSVGGQGNVDDTADVMAAGFSNKDYTLAHEHGHANSFPDEYSERINRCSHGASGIGYNSPGDQFVSDGYYHDLTASLFGAAHGAGTAPIAMMCQNNVPRNRYFWQNAEFARKHANLPFYAKLGGALPEYKVPGHPNFPQRNYVHWPVRDAIMKTRGKHGKFDVMLHAAGKDHYTVNLLPMAPVDAFLAIILKIDITFPAAGVAAASVLRDIMRSEILTANGKFKATGDAEVLTDLGKKTYPITSGSLRVSPRFIISNPDPSASWVGKNYPVAYAAAKAKFGVHFTANVVNNAGKVGKAIAPSAWTSKHAFDLAVDFTAPTANADLAALTQQFLQEMLGLTFNKAGVQAADLTDIAKLVIQKNAKVV